MRWFALGAALAACSSGPKAPKDLDGIDDPSVTPTKRSEILATADPAYNAILIFGGNDGPIVDQIPSARFREDTWIFEPGKGWTEITGDHPSARGRYAAELDPVNHRALLYGGRWREENTTGAYTLRTDLWAFDFETRTWTLLDDGTGDGAPRGRYYPASGYDAETGTFYLWGGALNRNPLNIRPGDDFWAFDGTSWTELETSGDAPSTRVFFGDTYDPTRKWIVVFGGQIGDFQSLAYQDLYALDVTTGQWRRLHDGTGTAPSTRMHAHLEYDPEGDRYLLWGGHTDIGDMNDLWAFDPDTGEWSLVYEADVFDNTDLGCAGNPREVPADYVIPDLSAPERRHRGMFALMWGNLWVYGGIHSECSDQLDDTWRYDLEEGAWHELIEAVAGESCARSGDDCQCLCF